MGAAYSARVCLPSSPFRHGKLDALISLRYPGRVGRRGRFMGDCPKDTWFYMVTSLALG